MTNKILLGALVVVMMFGAYVSLGNISTKVDNGYASLLAALSTTERALQTRVDSISPKEVAPAVVSDTSPTVFLGEGDYFKKLKLSVKMDGNGTGSVRGPGIVCLKNGNNRCSFEHVKGVIVPLLATPKEPSSFGGWKVTYVSNGLPTGECPSLMLTCQVTMNERKNVQAIFNSAYGTGTSTLILSLGQGVPVMDQVVNVSTAHNVYFPLKMNTMPSSDPVKVRSLKLTARGNLATTTLSNIRIYQGDVVIASAPQMDSCSVVLCVVVFSATDNILSTPITSDGVTLHVKADISAGGVAILGDDFTFEITSPNDVTAISAVTAAPANVVGTPRVQGRSFVVPQNVTISAVYPTTATAVGLGSGQMVGIFKIVNNGTTPISLSSSLKFANGGSATTSMSFKIYGSVMGGTQSDVSAWNGGNGYVGSGNGGSATINFTLATSSEELKIDGGSWRYITVKTNSAAQNNDTAQLSVSALGNIRFDVKESDLGYSGNNDSDLSDTIYGLYVDGRPSLATVTFKA